jgi:Ulp1 family protease
METTASPHFDLKHKEVIARMLRAKESLNDVAILNLLYLLCDWTETQHAMIIMDSLVVASLATTSEKTRKWVRQLAAPSVQKTFILVPLHNNNHWSLLVMVPSLCCYHHFDSLGAYHHEYATRTRLLIDPLDQYHELVLVDSVVAPEQLSNWECGLFLLMYAYLQMQALESLSNEETLAKCWSRYIASISEHNRAFFATRLLTRINTLH